MADKRYFSPAEAMDYLNKKFDLEPPINHDRLARLRRLGRIHGEKIGTHGAVYTKKALDQVTSDDLRDKRKRISKDLDKQAG